MKISSVCDRGLIRLISETRHKPPVLRDLVDSDEDAKLLAELEGETSARLIAQRYGRPGDQNLGLDRGELIFLRRQQDLELYAQTHINAAFAYAKNNRFNGSARGAWYCSYDGLTSAKEVGFHRTRELGYIKTDHPYQDKARYIELLADFIGDFPDLNGDPESLALDPDIETGYPHGQALAERLRREGHKGLLYPSVRHLGGRCFVGFDPGIVQNVRPGATWELVWNGSPDYSTEQMDTG